MSVMANQVRQCCCRTCPRCSYPGPEPLLRGSRYLAQNAMSLRTSSPRARSRPASSRRGARDAPRRRLGGTGPRPAGSELERPDKLFAAARASVASTSSTGCASARRCAPRSTPGVRDPCDPLPEHRARHDRVPAARAARPLLASRSQMTVCVEITERALTQPPGIAAGARRRHARDGRRDRARRRRHRRRDAGDDGAARARGHQARPGARPGQPRRRHRRGRPRRRRAGRAPARRILVEGVETAEQARSGRRARRDASRRAGSTAGARSRSSSPIAGRARRPRRTARRPARPRAVRHRRERGPHRAPRARRCCSR